MAGVSAARIEQDLRAIAAFNTTPGEGTTRLSYSDEDRMARGYLMDQMAKLDLSVTVDAVGNIRARMEGMDPTLPVVMTGSHIDTVLNGGDYDGVAGVVAGLEVLRVMKENHLQPLHPVELVVFVEEEGPQFGFPLAGSRLLTGAYGPEALKKQYDTSGISMDEAAHRFGLQPEVMAQQVLKPSEVKSMIELHIEQSVVLDETGISVGIVDAVFGRQWLEVSLFGRSNHAGATPMRFRQDAMAGAAAIMAKIPQLAAEAGSQTAVTTVGRIQCEPNQPNVIPEKVRFTVDIRDQDQASIQRIADAIRGLFEEACKANGLTGSVEKLSETQAITFSKHVVDTIEQAASDAGITTRRMQSGALHDACLMAGITETAMIFIPSVEGRSHCPQEFTEIEDIVKGTQVLLGSIASLSGVSIRP